MRKAAIDVGSNSVLLTVAEKVVDGWHSVLETSAVTGLGEGTKDTGLLGEEAMVRTLAALREAWEKARELGASDIRAAATMAARIARNADVFLDRASAQGTPVAVLGGEDEAELGFRAVSSDPFFAGSPRISVVDPGGHSTELLTADRSASGWSVRFRRSLPIGTLGLRGGILSAESPGPMEILRAVAEIDELIGLAYLPNQCGTVVVLGATGTNLVAIRSGLLSWVPVRIHGEYLDYEEVSKAFGWLAGMTDRGRAAVPGIEPGREQTIHLGALILERFLHALRAPGCLVSVRGWRHALLDEDGQAPHLSPG